MGKRFHLRREPVPYNYSLKKRMDLELGDCASIHDGRYSSDGCIVNPAEAQRKETEIENGFAFLHLQIKMEDRHLRGW